MTTEAALPTLSELAAAAKAAVRAAQNSIDEELVRRGEEERQEREKSKGDNNGDSSDESESEATETGSAAMKKRRGISELQKEEIRKHNSIKWRVVPTHGTPPPERYRHSATVVRHKRCDKDRGGRGGNERGWGGGGWCWT